MKIEKTLVFKVKLSMFTYNLKVYIFNFLNIFQGCIIGAGQPLLIEVKGAGPTTRKKLET